MGALEGKNIRMRLLAVLLMLSLSILAPAGSGNGGDAAKGLDQLGQGVGHLALTGIDGRQVRLRDFNGKPSVLFFGFTNCPVVCPVTVWEIDSALAELGEAGKGVRILFVTLDPERDTPDAMRKYFSGFKDRVTALWAPRPVVNRLAKAYDVRFERVQTGKGDYSIDHTAHAFLVNSAGRVVDTIAFGASRELSTSRLRKLTAPSPPRNK